MRTVLAAFVAVLPLTLACEADSPGTPSGPRALAPAANWPVPADCFSTEVAVDVDDEPAGATADDNGNGWVCRVIDTERADFGMYNDDHVSCVTGEPVFHPEGHVADENENGFVCEDGSTITDDVTDEGGVIPGPGTGGDVVCPPGYEPVSSISITIFGPSYDPADEDQDGWMCVDGDGNKVDNIVAGSPPTLALTAGKVNGHGVYDVEDSGATSTLSFSFHARSDGESVKGNFEFHDRASGARWHGDVTCLEVDGETAGLEGVVTKAKEAAPAEGTVVTWIAVDNGEGKKAPADEVSEPEVGGPAGDPCGPAPTGSPVPIDGGNVQVK